MTKKKPNAQRRTANIEWLRVGEAEAVYFSKATTSNAQRSTLDAQLKKAAAFDLEDRLLEFSARIIRFDSLPNTRAANHIAGQLLSSGTSPYGYRGEVEAAEPRRDFINKPRVCLKELKETRRWLRLPLKAQLVPEPKMAGIVSKNAELIKIFFTSVRTAERNSRDGSE